MTDSTSHATDTDLDLTITHDDADGTLLWNTSKGDGTAEILRSQGWRWSRNIAGGAWYLPHSREKTPKMTTITATADALRAAGWIVDLDIDSTPDSPAAAEERRALRARERAANLTAKAHRQQAKADAHDAAAQAISKHIPLGQPILAGHHSQRRAERDVERVTNHRRAAYEHGQAAAAATHRAAEAAADTGARHNPVTVANRIEALASELCTLKNANVPATDDRVIRAQAKLAHWNQIRTEQLAESVACNASPETVHLGDEVEINGRRYAVAKVNKKTVGVNTQSGYRTAPWTHVTGHRPR